MLTESNHHQPSDRRESMSGMGKLCRQVSIETPGPIIKDCVFSAEIPVPDVPQKGARIQVVCAGACYRMRNRASSVSSISSTSSVQSVEESPYSFSCTHRGIRDTALFPGYEVAGVIDELGAEVDCDLRVGQRVVIYPYEGIPHGYAEYIPVPDVEYIVPVPDELPLAVAAMLPSGALLAKNAVMAAHEYVSKLLEQRPANQDCKILIVGTGGLALWAIRIAEHHFRSDEEKTRVRVTVASLRDEGLKLAKEIKHVNVVQWNEDLYEKQIIERTKDACRGMVDIVIDFGTTSRSLHRSLQCLNTGGVVLVNEEVAEKLLPKFSRLAAERQQKIEAVSLGSIDQLKELIENVAKKEIIPPPHTEFSADEAPLVVQKLCDSEIPGRAILRFHDIQ